MVRERGWAHMPVCHACLGKEGWCAMPGVVAACQHCRKSSFSLLFVFLLVGEEKEGGRERNRVRIFSR